VAIGTDGNPVVSYQQHPDLGAALKVARAAVSG
jgi:hypothetical protein